MGNFCFQLKKWLVGILLNREFLYGIIFKNKWKSFLKIGFSIAQFHMLDPDPSGHPDPQNWSWRPIPISYHYFMQMWPPRTLSTRTTFAPSWRMSGTCARPSCASLSTPSSRDQQFNHHASPGCLGQCAIFLASVFLVPSFPFRERYISLIGPHGAFIIHVMSLLSRGPIFGRSHGCHDSQTGV